MTIETKLMIEKEVVTSFSEKNNEPTWLKEFRLEALEKAEALPMPKPDKTKIDKWNLAKFTQHTVDSQPFATLDELPEEVKQLVGQENDNNNLYIQRNNTPSFLQLSENVKKQGVIFTDILSAAREHGDLVEKYFMTDGVKVDEHRLAALHGALVNGGAFLYVPKNVEVAEPIQAVYIHDDKQAALFNHVIVVAEDNSSVTYVENYVSTGEAEEGIANIVAEVFANGNAVVHYGAVDHLAAGLTSYVNRRGIAQQDAQIEWALGAMNDGNTIYENNTDLLGDGSQAKAKTVVVGRGNQIENFTITITHHGKHTDGFILNHGVMEERATAIFNGIGKIEKGASKSNAVQESRILMLSDKARGDANPILLIDENDVTAGHAASVGRVDPLQLYYMMSRGIRKEDAERLLIHGFLSPVVNEIPIKSVQQQLTEIIERKIK